MTPESQTGRLPYRWGKFQGWLLTVGSPIFLLMYIYSVIYPTAIPRFAVIVGLVLCPLTFLMGVGILRKRTYGLYLVYAMLVYFVFACAVVVYRPYPGDMRSRLVPFLVWGACAVYYYKRRSEFH